MRTADEQRQHDALVSKWRAKGGRVTRLAMGDRSQGGVFKISWWVNMRMKEVRRGKGEEDVGGE